MTLALKYRPRSFSDLVGQKPVRLILQQMVIQQQLPPALLFTGSRGTGKTTSGRILAASLNCTARDKAEPCGQCAHCKSVFDGSSPDVIEVDAASNGLVDDIRKIREMVMYATGGEWRVVLLDEAHSMSREAFNAILKTLEEPPPNCLFILLTTEPAKILDTVISRCMQFEFRRISVADIRDRLSYVAEQESLELEPTLLSLIAERSRGGMRDAIMTLDQVSRVKVRTCEQFMKLMGESDFTPGLVKALVAGDLATAYGVVDEQMERVGDSTFVSSQLSTAFRDLLVIKSGGELACQGEALEARRGVASSVETDRLIAACRVMWDLRTRVRSSDDPRSALDLAVVLVSEALRGAHVSSAAAARAADPPKKLTLAELRSMEAASAPA